MISLLKHENKTVRYWTAKTLEGNKSLNMKDENVKQLLSKGLLDGN
jgi:hypothetical protein